MLQMICPKVSFTAKPRKKTVFSIWPTAQVLIRRSSMFVYIYTVCILVCRLIEYTETQYGPLSKQWERAANTERDEFLQSEKKQKIMKKKYI